MADFYQAGPELKNQYTNDLLLRSWLKRKLPKDVFTDIQPGLQSLGERAVDEILMLGRAAEAGPPVHVPYDAWGRRIDRIEVSDAWRRLERIAVEEGIVSTAYERKHGAHSRIHQLARLYLYGPSSAIATCPLAMTDGAARALELYGDEALKGEALPHLLSRDPEQFWSSGQWMTERTGGSDVGGTSTVARREGNGFRLYGTKWFTSATTSQMAMTLARIEGAPEGSRGLSLFYLRTEKPEGGLNQIFIHRLKDKLGTRALPTAELTLQGTPAKLVGGEGSGVKKIAALFNITRVYNACTSASFMRRGMALMRDYAPKRIVFGKPLSEQPLHLETLASLEVEFQGAFHLTFRVGELLGKDETGQASPEEAALLRLLTPLAKLFTAKQSVSHASEVLESFGGAGYVEDTGLPSLLRDAQVLAIWEGTTNVLSLDAVRAIEKENAYPSFSQDISRRLKSIQAGSLKASATRVSQALDQITQYLGRAQQEGAQSIQAGARELALSMARTYTASLLLEHADWALVHEHEKEAGLWTNSALRWCGERLVSPRLAAGSFGAEHVQVSRNLALSGDPV